MARVQSHLRGQRGVAGGDSRETSKQKITGRRRFMVPSQSAHRWSVAGPCPGSILRATPQGPRVPQPQGA